MDPYVPRTGGTLARSPSERLEPTRPPTRPRRRGGDREPRRSSPFVRFLNGLLTFVLLLMVVVGAIAYVFDAQVDAPGPLEKGKTVVIPKGEGTHEIAARLGLPQAGDANRLVRAAVERLRRRFLTDSRRPCD